MFDLKSPSTKWLHLLAYMKDALYVRYVLLIENESFMETIIQWLRKVEHLAGEVYSLAANEYADDSKFKRFLKRSAEDEAWHYHVMGSAAQFLSTEPKFTAAISVDSETSEKIINHLIDIKEGLENQTLTRDRLVEKIVQAEFSEWNDIFLYVVNTLKEKTSEFKFPAASMQAHIKGIADYVEKVENKSGIIDMVNNLPPVWIEKILVVDDTPTIANLLKNLLNRDGEIDIADNGKAALELIEKKYYKLVISDIDMPVMDGLTLFDKAVERFPKIKTRFLFMTGDLSPERSCFFNDNNVKCLEKPVGIKSLRDEAKRIILS